MVDEKKKEKTQEEETSEDIGSKGGQAQGDMEDVDFEQEDQPTGTREEEDLSAS